MDIHRGPVFSCSRDLPVEGMHIREASRVFGVHRNTADKMLANPASLGYRRKRHHHPKLAPCTGVIEEILCSDLKVSKKRSHTAKLIHVRLRVEHGFDGGYTRTLSREGGKSHIQLDYSVLKYLMLETSRPASPESHLGDIRGQVEARAPELARRVHGL